MGYLRPCQITMCHVYKNVGFARGNLGSTFPSKKVGGHFFQFLDHHNFHIHNQNLAEKVYLDSTHQELSIDMLHDILFPYQFESRILFEFRIQKYSRWSMYA